MSVVKELYAHSANSQGKKHRLDDHLKEVAELAKNSPISLGPGELAYCVGLWHDLNNHITLKGGC